MSYITLSPGIRCIYSCHSCYMSGPAAPPPPYIVQYSISGALSATSCWQRDHLVSCFHLVDERTNYQSFHHYLVPLTLCRPEIRTDSPNLQLPVMRQQIWADPTLKPHRRAECTLSAPSMCSAYFRKLTVQWESSQAPFCAMSTIRKWVVTSFATLHLHERDLSYRVRFNFCLNS